MSVAGCPPPPPPPHHEHRLSSWHCLSDRAAPQCVAEMAPQLCITAAPHAAPPLPHPALTRSKPCACRPGHGRLMAGPNTSSVRVASPSMS